jgi:hypothetical protein
MRFGRGEAVATSGSGFWRRANGQPAVATYMDDGMGAFPAYGIMVFALEGDTVAASPAGYPELFPELALPRALP